MEPVLALPLLDLECEMPQNISKQFNMHIVYATESRHTGCWQLLHCCMQRDQQHGHSGKAFDRILPEAETGPHTAPAKLFGFQATGPEKTWDRGMFGNSTK